MTRRGFRWRLRSSPLILLYHRVANAELGPHSNVSGLSVTPEHFEQQLAVLRRRFAPLRLRDLLESPPRFRHPAVAVTFDDGYADNLHAALPLLERFGIPATFFVTSGMLGGEDIGLEEVGDAVWNIVYYNTVLGRIDLQTGKITGSENV